MALKIFDVDPDAAPRKPLDDLVGRFRSGALVQGRPMALTEWRFTTGDPDVAKAVADLLGGEPAEWDTPTEEVLEVYTSATEVDVILDGPSAVKSGMVLWGRNAMIRSCDGVTQKDGSACACPQKITERKEASKAGTGCDPSIQVYFRLADLPDLGKLRFMSGSWSMAAEIGEAEEKLAKIDGPALGKLTLVPVNYTTKAGREVSYTKPVLTVTGPAPSDVFPGGDS